MADNYKEKLTLGNFYPKLAIDHIQNPNRFYAFPIIGFVFKIIILIPVFIWMWLLSLAYFFVTVLINPLVVLFTGKYWEPAYELSLGIMRIQGRAGFFLSGLTNEYPGFSLQNQDNINIDIALPEKPNRLFAIPVLGGIARVVLLIPYLIYASVIQTASGYGMIGSFVKVLFVGKYPESTYELMRDYTRISLALSSYMSGLSDSYPNFWISMNHKAIKIFLIILGILGLLSNGMNYNTAINDMQNQQYNSTSPFNTNTDGTIMIDDQTRELMIQQMQQSGMTDEEITGAMQEVDQMMQDGTMQQMMEQYQMESTQDSVPQY